MKASTAIILHTKTIIKSVFNLLHTTYTNVTHKVLAKWQAKASPSN